MLQPLPATFPGSNMVPKICPPGISGRLSPSFLAAFTLITSGCFLRWLCFRALGKLFTFEVTIRSNHEIVDVGPYAVVRHPSYTGVYMLWIGTAVLIFSPEESPAIACGWAAASIFIRLAMVSWTFAAVFWWSSILKRVPFEEENLRIHFGQKWVEYTKRVPYRYLPGVVWINSPNAVRSHVFTYGVDTG